MLLLTKANLGLVDLLASKKPDIIGAPPSSEAKLTKAMRIFYNGRTNYEGPACLLNPAATRIKKQIGDGKVTKPMALYSDDEDDRSLSLSPSPVPMKLRSAPHRGRKELMDQAAMERDSSVRPLNPRHGHKKVAVVVTKKLPSVITINSSGSEEGNVGDKGKEVSVDTTPLIVMDDEEVRPTHKRKAKSQQSTRAIKRVALSPDSNTTRRSGPKAMKASTKTTKRTRFRIESPLDSESGEESLKGHSSQRTATPMPIQNVRANTPINVPSSRVSIRPQQASKELHPEQHKLTLYSGTHT